MLDKINCTNISLNLKNCIIKIIKNIFGEINVYIYESGKIMINDQMTLELLNNYVNKGSVVVYEFDNEQQAKKFASRNSAISKLNAKIAILSNQIQVFEKRFWKNKVSLEQIFNLERLQKEKEELEKIIANRYYSTENKEEI